MKTPRECHLAGALPNRERSTRRRGPRSWFARSRPVNPDPVDLHSKASEARRVAVWKESAQQGRTTNRATIDRLSPRTLETENRGSPSTRLEASAFQGKGAALWETATA